MPRGEGHQPSEKIEPQFDLFPNGLDKPLSEDDVVGVKPEPPERVFGGLDLKQKGADWKKLRKLGVLLGTVFGIGASEGATLKKLGEDSEEMRDKIGAAQLKTVRAEWNAKIHEQVKEFIVESNGEPIELGFSKDPDVFKELLRSAITDKSGLVDSEVKKAIDLGETVLAYLEANGTLTAEAANLARTKREKFREMAKTEPISKVLHEIVQEHEHYNPEIVDLENFIKTGTGNCRSSALGFVTYVEAVRAIYPNMELKFQYFSGKYESHVRALVIIEGQAFALEKPTPTPIVIEPGTVIEPAANILSVLADTRTNEQAQNQDTPEIVNGEAKKAPGEDEQFDEEKAAEAEKLKDKTVDGIMDVLSATKTVKPTAHYNDSSISAPKEQPRVSYEEAQKQLAESNPVQTRIQEEIDKQVAEKIQEKQKKQSYEKVYKKILDIQTKLKSSGKEATPKQEEELMTLFAEAETAGLLEKLTADLNTWNAILKNHDGLVSTGMEPLKLDTIAQKTLDILERYKNGPDEDPGPHMSPEQRKRFLQAKIEALKQNLIANLSDKGDNNGYGIKLTIEELNQLSLAAQTGWKLEQKTNSYPLPISRIDFSYTILPTLNADWFKNLPFTSKGIDLTFESRDTTLDAFASFDSSQIISDLDISAPLENFSGIGRLEIHKPIFRNISPEARLETLDYNPNTVDDAPTFVNPPPEVSFAKLQPIFKNRIKIELDTAGTYIMDKRDLSQFQECRSLSVDADFTNINLSKLANNKNLDQLTIKNPRIKVQDWGFLKTLPETTMVVFEFTDEKNKDSEHNFTTFADFVIFSKTYPNISFEIPPKQSWEIYTFDDGKDLGPADTVHIEDGEILGSEKEKPQGEYANRVGALIEKLFKPGLHQNPREDVKNAMLEIPGSELPSIIAYLTNQPLSAEEKQIFEEAVTAAKEALAEKQKFQDYKHYILDQGDQAGIGTIYFKPGDAYTTHEFNPTEENLREITEAIVVQNKKRKAHGQKPREITVFEPSTRLTAASEIWFNRLPLAKTINNFELNTGSDALEFVVKKLRGKHIDVIKVIDNDQTSRFKSFNDLQFTTLVIKKLKTQQKLLDFSPEVQARTTVDYIDSPKAMDKESIGALSKLFPKITFKINNPDYGVDASTYDINAQPSLTFMNGDIQ